MRLLEPALALLASALVLACGPSGTAGAPRNRPPRPASDRKARDTGHAALTTLAQGEALWFGLHPDRPRALELYARACDLGSGDACYRVSKLGPESGPDRLRQRSCDLGFAVACAELIEIHASELHLLADFDWNKQPFRELRRRLADLCDRDDLYACDRMVTFSGRWRLFGGSEEAKEKADDRLGSLVDSQCMRDASAAACSRLAYWGRGDAEGMARKRLPVACEALASDDCALFSLTLVIQGELTGLEVADRACTNGGRLGCGVLAGFYGYHLSPALSYEDNTQASLRYLRRACELGLFDHPLDRFLLGAWTQRRCSDLDNPGGAF